MWTALLNGTTQWLAIAIVALVLVAALLIVHLVRASDGEMSVRLRWLGLHVQHKAANSSRQD